MIAEDEQILFRNGDSNTAKEQALYIKEHGKKNSSKNLRNKNKGQVMEKKIYELLGIKWYRKFVIKCKFLYNKLTKTENNDNYFLKGFASSDINFLENQFKKNLMIHLIGTAIGLCVFILVVTDDHIGIIKLIVSILIILVNGYSSMLQRYNLIRIHRLKRK